MHQEAGDDWRALLALAEDDNTLLVGARSLGADGFLQKPVLPQDFLRALDWQMDHFSQP